MYSCYTQYYLGKRIGHLPDTLQTTFRNLSYTLQPPFRHLPDTLQTSVDYLDIQYLHSYLIENGKRLHTGTVPTYIVVTHIKVSGDPNMQKINVFGLHF